MEKGLSPDDADTVVELLQSLVIIVFTVPTVVGIWHSAGSVRMSSPSFVAYYRVSTDRQGRSGLGLDAQRRAVSEYLGASGLQPVSEFTEVESGRRADRPELAKALAACRRHGARLVIAKLDRLARNVAFVSGLMEADVDFVACDMPHANRLTIHILAAVAEHEREMISARTKAALAAARARGTLLGFANPALEPVR